MAYKHRTMGRSAKLPLVSLIIVLVIIAIGFRAASDFRHAARGVDTMNDDAYYYTVVARNLATTGEMTFEGISRTNGYHPLWFWLQVVMFKAGASGLSPTGQALAVMVLQWSILGLAFAMLLSGVYRMWSEHPNVAAATLMGVILLAYPKHLSPFTIGMESALVLPLLPILLLLVLRSRWMTAGVVALLLVMARLDTLVYVVFPISLYAALKERTSPVSLLKAGLRVGGPALAGVVVLMTVYQFTFGHPIPIHGVLRSSFPSINFQPHLFTDLIAYAVEVGSPGRLAMFHLPTALVILPVCAFALAKAGYLNRSERSGAGLLVCLGLIQLVAFLLFQEWAKPISGWYLAPLLVFSSGAVGAAAANLLGRHRTVVLCLLLALGVAGLSGVREYRRRNMAVPHSKVHEFVRSRPGDAVWAATDCGTITFWTGATFVNLDGLINGFDYQAALERRDLRGYLERSGVDYLVVGAWKTRPASGHIDHMYVHRVDPALYSGEYETYDFFVYSYMYQTYSDTISLSRDREVWRSGPERDRDVLARTIIFNLAGHDTEPGKDP